MKIAHFRLPSPSQKRACLSSLIKTNNATLAATYWLGHRNHLYLKVNWTHFFTIEVLTALKNVCKWHPTEAR